MELKSFQARKRSCYSSLYALQLGSGLAYNLFYEGSNINGRMPPVHCAYLCRGVDYEASHSVDACMAIICKEMMV